MRNRKPEDTWKSVMRPYKIVVVSGIFLRRYVVIATSANAAIQSVELGVGEFIAEAKEFVGYELVIT